MTCFSLFPRDIRELHFLCSRFKKGIEIIRFLEQVCDRASLDCGVSVIVSATTPPVQELFRGCVSQLDYIVVLMKLLAQHINTSPVDLHDAFSPRSTHTLWTHQHGTCNRP